MKVLSILYAFLAAQLVKADNSDFSNIWTYPNLTVFGVTTSNFGGVSSTFIVGHVVTTANPINGQEMFLMKVNSTGDVEWYRTFGRSSSNNDNAGFCHGGLGSVCYGSSPVVDPATGDIFVQGSVTYSSYQQAYIERYRSNGTRVFGSWQVYGLTSAQSKVYPTALKLSGDGLYLYAVGYFNGNITGSKVSIGAFDAYVHKFSFSNTGITPVSGWPVTWQTEYAAYAAAMDIDPLTGDIFVTGLAAERTLNYTELVQMDHIGSDLTDTNNVHPSTCRPMCDSLPRCIAFNIIQLGSPTNVRCWFKYVGVPYATNVGVSFYYVGQLRNYLFMSRIQESSRSLLYTKIYNGTDTETSVSIAVDSHNSVVYIAGMTNSQTFNGEANTDNNFEQQYVSQLSMADGTVQWTRIFGGYGDGDSAVSLAIHNLDRSVYVAGRVAAKVPLDGSTNTTYYGGEFDFSLAKFNPNGSRAWLVTAGSSGDDRGQAIGFNSRYELIVLGYYNGNSSIFVNKKDALPDSTPTPTPMPTTTTTPTPTPTPSASPSPTPTLDNNDPVSPINAGRNVIADAVGGTFGGLALLLAVAGGVFYFISRRRENQKQSNNQTAEQDNKV